ncbi:MULTISPECIES: transglutaminase-like domain-containing protein [Sphingobium]|uniref:transglutaminase-like domain-containing protein n=1 Tax=Sphingobium TaxID=165695 RepID=UPI00159C1681|nr:transglutaminase family protein [Sphingobium sp. 15-1]
MKLNIHAQLHYALDEPTDLLLQIEAADIPEQTIDWTALALPEADHVARVPAQDCIGDRIWLRLQGEMVVDYQATVTVNRILADCRTLSKVPLHQLPGETVPYLLSSRYCESDRFKPFVDAEFGKIQGGVLIMAMRDWIHGHLNYVPGSSDVTTTAADTFIARQGICRDYAHLLITLARAAGIPARMASVYALGVDPPDFHAVAEVFLGGEWHLIDATGMAREAAMAKIGIGRDAADVAFLTAFGDARLIAQSVSVEPHLD